MLLLRFSAYLLLLTSVLILVEPPAGYSQSDQNSSPGFSGQLADVRLDGKLLFEVRGVSALPAKLRAERIRESLVEAAQKSETASVEMETHEEEFGLAIFADGVRITIVTPLDADAEDLTPNLLADLHSKQIQNAIIDYRQSRSDEGRLESIFELIAETVIFAIICFLLFHYRVKAANWVEKQVSQRLADVDEVTGEIIRSETIATVARQTVSLASIVVFLVLLYYYLSVALYSFAETRGLAQILLKFISEPAFNIFIGILNEIPSLVALLIIFALTRFLIKLLRLVFLGIEKRTFKIKGFEKQWIWPTFNIGRALVIVFALVLAYPYIPGSGSEAFKGMSIVLGVMVSLGSSSVIGNLLAGVFIIYKRSTNIGDRIKVGDHVGDVVAIKMMETHLKSIKNELISIPNAELLNSDVVNYSAKVEGKGLLVYASVGIGYEEPRRKIEAMLIEAANRTDGLKTTPPPFVLQMELADFAVVYQVNGYALRGESLQVIRSDLLGHILDVFSEEGVQIMTPSYIADPKVPKIPPVEKLTELAQPKSVA